MAESVRKVRYFAADVTDQPGEGARVLETLAARGVNFHAFSGFPRGGGNAQLDFVPEDPAAFEQTAREVNLGLRGPKTAFVVQGEDTKGAVARVLRRLADANVNVTAVHAIAAGSGVYGGILWVQSADVERAATVLQAS